jgi:hypothetical protein
MKSKFVFMLMAACLLLASECRKPEEELPILPVQDKPQRPGAETDPPTPTDSLLPPYMERWIWVRYYRDDGCLPITEEFSPPESCFGADASAIILNWLDSTYVSQSCWSAGNFQIVPESFGKFSMRDTTYTLDNITHDTIIKTYIRFNNGITMGPLECKEWIVRYAQSNDAGFYNWAPKYVETYQTFNSFVILSTNKYKQDFFFTVYFLRITPENQYHYLNRN